MNYQGYKELNCYKKARELRISISALVKKFPSSEKFLLVAQIIDSSRSITRNIAEGYGRFTYADTKNFFIMARGSVTETMESLSTAHDENYITDEELQSFTALCEEVFRLINGYISYLDRSKPVKRSAPNPNS